MTVETKLALVQTVSPEFLLEPLHRKFGSASVDFDGRNLVVSTGAITRAWRWTGYGLATVSLIERTSGREWCTPDPAPDCDWSNPDVIPSGATAELRAVSAKESDDEGFSSPHLEVAIEIGYPSQGVAARYVIWAYPESRGLRTQLWWKSSRLAQGEEISVAKPAIVPVWADAGCGAMSQVICSYYELRFRLEKLHPGLRYVAVVTWSNPDGSHRLQSISLSSVDGETTSQVVPATPLGAKKATSSFELPAAVRPDGSCVISIQRNAEAPNACIDELGLYVEEGSDAVAHVSGRAGRRPAESVPVGLTIVASLCPAMLREQDTLQKQEERRVDFVPVSPRGREQWAIGYFNDTQNRNRPETPILREEAVKAKADWASVFCLEDAGGGLAMIKESHKCVNQPGVDTGTFECGPQGVSNTGWGLAAKEVSGDRFRWCWASWVILYEAPGADARQRAIKEFDRLRFPARAERDLWTVVCTWGHGRSAREGRDAAAETEVLREMEIAARLGMDLLLIDDGWQVGPRAESWQPAAGVGWNPHPQTYPLGWPRVVEAKDRLRLRLGLWAVAQHATADDLLRNWRILGMEQVKLDFANLKNQRELDQLISTVRQFVRATGHRCIVSWDTTENQARYGYYWAREYGNVHFLNRKPERPERVIYVPWLALRDFWQLAHYQNLNKWQLTIQNPEVVNSEKSDAHLHGAGYCVATALMGIPEFMALPRYYSAAARAEIGGLLQVYNLHRRAIFDALVYPIGDEPSNASWSGFQSWDASSEAGYLTIFRERHNGEAERALALRFVAPGTVLRLLNLRTGERRQVAADDQGRVSFAIAVPPGFLFLRYERVGADSPSLRA